MPDSPLEFVPTQALFNEMAKRCDAIVIIACRDHGEALTWNLFQRGNHFTRLGLVIRAAKIIHHEMQALESESERLHGEQEDGE